MRGEGGKGGEGGVEEDKCSCLTVARRRRVVAGRRQPTQLHTARGAAVNSHGTAGHTTPDTVGKHRRGKKSCARRHSAATGRVRGDERERLAARGGSYLAEAWRQRLGAARRLGQRGEETARRARHGGEHEQWKHGDALRAEAYGRGGRAEAVTWLGRGEDRRSRIDDWAITHGLRRDHEWITV